MRKNILEDLYIYIYKERERGGGMLIFVENNIVHKLRTNDAW